MQVISVWGWEEGGGALYSAEIAGGDTQTCVRFNPNDPTELMSNGRTKVDSPDGSFSIDIPLLSFTQSFSSSSPFPSNVSTR